MSLIGSVGVTKNITGLTVHLSLTFAISIENIVTLPHSEMISDHSLVTFELWLNHDILCAPWYNYYIPVLKQTT